MRRSMSVTTSRAATVNTAVPARQADALTTTAAAPAAAAHNNRRPRRDDEAKAG